MDYKIQKNLDILHEHFNEEDNQYSKFESLDQKIVFEALKLKIPFK